MYLIGQIKPSRLTEDKGKKYHADMARYCIGAGYFDSRHSSWLQKIDLNKKFYKGDQYIKNEDLSAFFLSANGDPTTRIKMVFNIIRPMVEQYRGSSLNMDFNGQVYAIGSQANSRKVKRYERLDFYDDLSRTLPDQLSGAIRQKLPIGDTKSETRMNFENIDVDDVVETYNNYLANVKKRSKLDDYKLPFAQSLAFSGAVITYPYEHYGHWAFRHVQPETFFWDRSAREYNLKDASFWGERWDVDNATIFETWQDIPYEYKKALDNYDSNYADTQTTRGTPGTSFGGTEVVRRGKTPVFKVAWVDTEQYEYGYVLDEYGEPFMTRINYTYEDDEKPRYTKKDLVPLDNLPKAKKKILKGKATRLMSVDLLRYCDIIPQEYIGTYKISEGDTADVVLAYGIMESCQRDPMSPFNIIPPYIVNFWSYVDGEALSPIDDSIDPQRFINRLISISENRINHSTSDIVAFDRSALPQEDGAEEEFYRSIATGKPVAFESRGMGLPNSIQNISSNISNATMSMFNLVNSVVGFNQYTSGINSEMNGQASGGSEQLVGVTEALIQRGSILQQPFYNAISDVYLGLFNSIMSLGRKIYANNGTELYDMVGEGGYGLIKITKEMALEDMACDIRRDAGDPILKQAANKMLFDLLQMGIIDKGTFANLNNKSTPETIAIALRRIAREEAQVAQAQAKQEEGMMKQVAAETQAQSQQQQELQKATIQQKAMSEDLDRKNKLDQVVAKGVVASMNKK